MTRRVVYGAGLLLTVVCTAMTIASIVMPRWISYAPNHDIKSTMGLHQQCSMVTGTCVSFPQAKDCPRDKRYFCDMWKTVGFLISFSVVVELACLVSFVVIMAGGVQRRSAGWKVITSLVTFGGLVQCAGMAIVAFLFDNEDRFFEGWFLDVSWSLTTASWSILILTALGMTASAIYLPQEGDYEMIPDCNMEVDEQLHSRINGWNDGYQNERD